MRLMRAHLEHVHSVFEFDDLVGDRRAPVEDRGVRQVDQQLGGVFHLHEQVLHARRLVPDPQRSVPPVESSHAITVSGSE